MKPWDIIGWAIIALTLFVIGNAMLRIFMSRLRHHIRYYRYRNTPVELDQTWVFPDGSEIWVKHIWDTHYTLCSGSRFGGSSCSWGIDKNEWQDYVRNHKIYLKE